VRDAELVRRRGFKGPGLEVTEDQLSELSLMLVLAMLRCH
jgi:hypothetical protein